MPKAGFKYNQVSLIIMLTNKRRLSPYEKKLSYVRRRKTPSIDRLSALGDNLAFEEACRRYEKLINYGVKRFGNARESYKENLHHARLALWKTLLWKNVTKKRVTHSSFLGKFMREMKSAVGNDSIGEIQRVKVRLDNPRRNWHERMADEKVHFAVNVGRGEEILDLGSVRTPFGLRGHFRSEEAKKILLRERRKRYRWKKSQKKILATIEHEKKAATRLEENIARSKVRFEFLIKQMHILMDASKRDVFLFKPSQLIKVLSLVERTADGGIGLVKPQESYLRMIRILMGRAAPENPAEVKRYAPRKIKGDELRGVIGILDNLIDFYELRHYTEVADYLTKLRHRVQSNKNVPVEIIKDLDKLAGRSDVREHISESASEQFYDDVY